MPSPRTDRRSSASTAGCAASRRRSTRDRRTSRPRTVVGGRRRATMPTTSGHITSARSRPRAAHRCRRARSRRSASRSESLFASASGRRPRRIGVRADRWHRARRLRRRTRPPRRRAATRAVERGGSSAACAITTPLPGVPFFGSAAIGGGRRWTLRADAQACFGRDRDLGLIGRDRRRHGRRLLARMLGERDLRRARWIEHHLRRLIVADRRRRLGLAARDLVERDDVERDRRRHPRLDRFAVGHQHGGDRRGGRHRWRRGRDFGRSSGGCAVVDFARSCGPIGVRFGVGTGTATIGLGFRAACVSGSPRWRDRYTDQDDRPDHAQSVSFGGF